jgi:hypothetical protein
MDVEGHLGPLSVRPERSRGAFVPALPD